MACGTAFDAFKVASEYLGPDIYRRSHFNSVMQNVVKEGTFPEGVGTSASVFTIEPNEPGTLNTGGAAITTTGSPIYVSGACTYSFTDLNIGFTETTYSPKKLQYRGPLFCKDEQYFHHDASRFLDAYVDELSKYVQFDYDYFLFYHYARFVPIYVANAAIGSALGTASTNLTATAATSELTQDMLDRLVPLLIYNRATPSSSDGNGWVSLEGPSGPLWTLQIGPEASARVKTNNGDFRTDLRYGNANSLLNRLGATEAVKNFRHLPQALPWRFTHDGSKYVIVQPFTSGSATKGNKTTINPNYINPATAPYEAALVLNPNVMEVEMVKPKSSVGPAKWADTNYMGEWQWITGTDALQAAAADACYDPLGKFGRHIGEIIAAPKPGSNVNAGAIIFHKRCASSATTVACT